MAQDGLLRWANSVRMNMASDPGRKLFQEQIQTHGFSFLDDYLHNILYGTKQDPLIELVKTPGRKKAISRKPKLASKLAQVVTVSFETDDEENAGENALPVNSFTQALLNVKSQATSKQLPQPPPESHDLPVPPETSASSVIPNPNTGGASTQDRTAVIQPVELSIIAEDDEGSERSRLYALPKAEPTLSNADGQSQPAPMQVDAVPRAALPGAVSSLPPPPPEDDTESISASSVNTFHSIPLESPSVEMSNPPTQPDEMQVVDISVPIRDPEEQPSSPKPHTHKSILSGFPTLPEPIPLRKSMRATKEHLVNNVMQGAATPGNTAAGKRTSWLMKAREAKAMEGVHKKSIASFPPVVTPGPVGVKRKSEEAVDAGDEERISKAIKLHKDEVAPVRAPSPQLSEGAHTKAPAEITAPSGQDEMLDRLKKAVQGLEARNDKPSGKVFGGAAAALAEARAQAEARIAERNHKEEGRTATASGSNATEAPAGEIPDVSPTENDQPFNISDLFPKEGKIKDKSRALEKSPAIFSEHAKSVSFKTQAQASYGSTSTTPPHSPPPQNVTQPSAPVFNKPPPVFVPPVPSTRPLPTPPPTKESGFNLPPLPAFTKPASMVIGVPPRLGLSPSSSKVTLLSAQSTLETVVSDDFFGERGHTEAWVPTTQDTEYSSAFNSQQQATSNHLDDDDSWPIEEKLSQGAHWPFEGPSKEDSMTWSTLPSQSQRETGPTSKDPGTSGVERTQGVVRRSGPVGEEDMDIEHHDYNTAVDSSMRDVELEELILSGTKRTGGAPTQMEGDNHPPLASSVSSHSQAGFFGQASKFLSSALGSSKKNKPEMTKVMQMAAVAAKKQQQEDDKKAARLKEMENRRQAALQRKAEEEKTKQQEQERKAKEEAEKRKREREDQVEKKPTKPTATNTVLKKDEEVAKKRKMEHEKTEKKTELKKQTPLGKAGFKPTSSKQANALSSSTAYNTSQSQPVALAATKAGDKPSKVPTAIPTKGKSKPSPKAPAQVDEDHTQPSQIVQTQMAARAKAAMQTETSVPSESIELPEVNSEYSDSEDEDRPRTFNPPEWAQSPDLRQALHAQSTINPDDIFGSIRPLRMEEMFKARTSRFRARTSSANWSGADRLTVEEEREYARRMGFK